MMVLIKFLYKLKNEIKQGIRIEILKMFLHVIFSFMIFFFYQEKRISINVS